MRRPFAQGVRHSVATLATLAFVFCLTTSARAAPYTFTLIADSRFFSDFQSFRSPSLGANGTVVFMLTENNGPNTIFTGNGGALTAIPLIGPAGTVGATSVAGTPAINAAGTIALQGAPQGGGDGIYLSNGGPLIQVATNLGGFPFLGFAPPSINGFGRVAFVADFGGGQGAFRSEPGGQFTDIVDNTGVFDGFVNNLVSINDAGQVAFFARFKAGPINSGVFVGSGGALTTIAETGTQFDGFVNVPVINNVGQVAFEAGLVAGGAGIYVGTGATLTLIADTNGVFTHFPGSPHINDAGTVVFAAGLQTGGAGIFTGPDPVADRVIAEGDPLFGSIVDAGSLTGAVENDRGQIVFMATLTNGDRVLVRADPSAAVPEPSSLTLLVLAGGTLAAWRWRRLRDTV
jgi:hypothetical protein